MPSTEGSYLGLAIQDAKGTPNTTDAEFEYLLFLESAFGVNNINLPLDPEVGGGAFLRNVVKAGVTSGGAVRFIPRPSSIGHFLMAFFGNQAAPVEGTDTDVGTYSHAFSFGSSQFYEPYYTFRDSPGGMIGYQYPDCRMSAFGFEFRAADFIRASAAFVGGEPEKVSTAAWSPSTYLDNGPQFLSVISRIEIPDATAWSVLQGSLAFQSAIPLDQQFVVGSYAPDDFTINARGVTLNLRVKVSDDGVLYNKMMLDPAGGSSWAADLMKEGSIDLSFVSNQEIVSGSRPYSILVAANGQSGDAGNVVFSVNPLQIVPGRQVVMDVTGTFLADDTSPFSVTLVNERATAYDA